MLSITNMANLSITPERLLIAAAVLLPYLLLVKRLRFQRARKIEAEFNGRPLSSMTVKEAHEIFRELRELEFPYTLHSAMKLSLLKVSFHIRSCIGIKANERLRQDPFLQ